MNGIYAMNEGQLRMALIQAQRLGADVTARRLERQLAAHFARHRTLA